MICYDDILNLSDYETGNYILMKDSIYKRIKQSDRENIINRSIMCAEEKYDELKKQYGNLKPLEYAEKLNIKISKSDEKMDRYFPCISSYNQAPPVISLSMPAVRMINDRIKQLKISGRDIDIIDTAVAHELFHHIEYKDKGIYTTNVHVEIYKIGKIEYKTCPLCASEIAAVHFSKICSKIDFSPVIFEKLLQGEIKGGKLNE